MQSKPKTQRTSSTSSSPGSAKRKIRVKQQPTTPTNNVAVCNGTPSLPFKKRKLAVSETSSETRSSLSPECFTAAKVPKVALIDMLNDEELCSAYRVHEKLEQSTGSVATATTGSIPSDGEFQDGDYFLDEDEQEEGMEAPLVNFEQMAEERKVVMQKNNMIMITRCVNTNEGCYQPSVRRSLGNYHQAGTNQRGSQKR